MPSPISASLFEDSESGVEQHRDIATPLALSSSTTGSTAARLAWRSNERGSGPSAYSSKTRGTTLNWDDTPKAEAPTSDKGASFGGA
jgi:hypothetical protein